MFKCTDSAHLVNGIKSKFSLVCIYSKLTEKKKPLNGAVAFKNPQNHKCTVAVHFRFKPNSAESAEGKFVRSNHI
jgi:hypothetical protein